MKVMIVLVLSAAAIFGVVKVLGSTQGEAEYPQFDAGVTGPLEIGAVSQAEQAKLVTKACRRAFTAKDKREITLGELKKGEKFTVLNHFRNGLPLWVYIQSNDRPQLKGWVVSDPEDPFIARKLN